MVLRRLPLAVPRWRLLRCVAGLPSIRLGEHVNDERTRTMVALLSAGVAGIVAVSQPSLVPALTLAAGVWLAAATFLEL